MISCIVLLLCINVVIGFKSSLFNSNFNQQNKLSKFVLRKIPLELEGQLDPNKSWSVKFIFNDVEKIVNVPESTSFLEAGEKACKRLEIISCYLYYLI